MSEEGGGFGYSVAERFFGFILVVVGILVGYYTFTSVESLANFTGLFGFLSIIIVIVGIILITAKTE